MWRWFEVGGWSWGLEKIFTDLPAVLQRCRREETKDNEGSEGLEFEVGRSFAANKRMGRREGDGLGGKTKPELHFQPRQRLRGQCGGLF